MSPTVAPLSAENHAPSTVGPGLIFYYLWAKRTNVETETVLDGWDEFSSFPSSLSFLPRRLENKRAGATEPDTRWANNSQPPLPTKPSSRRRPSLPLPGCRVFICDSFVSGRFVRELRLILAAGLDHIASEKVLSCPVPCCPHYSTPTWITKSSTPSPSQNRRRQKVRPPNKSGGFRVVKNVDSTQKYFQGRLSRTPSIGPSTTAVHRQTLQIVHR
jgi:hypothetical protein